MNKYKATLEYYGENKPAKLIVHPDNLLLPVDVEFVVKIAGGERLELDRPRGEWIYGEDESGQDGWFCSECKFFVPWYYQYFENDIDFIRDYKVCPHCLAEMITYTGKERR